MQLLTALPILMVLEVFIVFMDLSNILIHLCRKTFPSIRRNDESFVRSLQVNDFNPTVVALCQEVGLIAALALQGKPRLCCPADVPECLKNYWVFLEKLLKIILRCIAVCQELLKTNHCGFKTLRADQRQLLKVIGQRTPASHRCHSRTLLKMP